MSVFYQDLDGDRIRKKNGEAYRRSTKDEFIRNLKRYLKTVWDQEEYDKKARWMREYDEIPDIPALTMEEVKRLSAGFKFLRDRALTLFLGDSGCRIEEALNLKANNIERKQKPDGDEYYIVSIEGTKTREAKRRISLPIASGILTRWLSHLSVDSESFLFPVSYDAYRKVLRETSKIVIGRVVTPHQLRHSSATYYCQKINNPYKFVYRYGWTINSDQARRYIDRSKLGDEAQAELDNIIKRSKVQELSEEVERIQLENKVLYERSQRGLALETQVESLKEELRRIQHENRKVINANARE